MTNASPKNNNLVLLTDSRRAAHNEKPKDGLFEAVNQTPKATQLSLSLSRDSDIPIHSTKQERNVI